MVRFYFIGFWLALPVVSVAALVWGGWTERRAALLFPGAAVASTALRAHGSASYHHLELGLFGIDLLLLAGLMHLVRRSGRTWPIWAAAFQTLATLSHLGKLTNPGLWRLGYAIMAESSSYPSLIALAIGTWTWRRRRVGTCDGYSERAAPGTARGTLPF